jgi:hypothetical protein
LVVMGLKLSLLLSPFLSTPSSSSVQSDDSRFKKGDNGGEFCH